MITAKKVWYAPNGFEAYGEDEIKAVEECLRDGWLAGFGKRTIEFEEKVSAMFGKKFGLFVNSGSSACMLALASLDLENGCEIVTPACTFSTTVAPMIQLGLKPVFCDVVLNQYVSVCTGGMYTYIIQVYMPGSLDTGHSVNTLLYRTNKSAQERSAETHNDHPLC